VSSGEITSYGTCASYTTTTTTTTTTSAPSTYSVSINGARLGSQRGQMYVWYTINDSNPLNANQMSPALTSATFTAISPTITGVRSGDTLYFWTAPAAGPSSGGYYTTAQTSTISVTPTSCGPGIVTIYGNTTVYVAGAGAVGLPC
jgi:hypothetical protein